MKTNHDSRKLQLAIYGALAAAAVATSGGASAQQTQPSAQSSSGTTQPPASTQSTMDRADTAADRNEVREPYEEPGADRTRTAEGAEQDRASRSSSTASGSQQGESMRDGMQGHGSDKSGMQGGSKSSGSAMQGGSMQQGDSSARQSSGSAQSGEGNTRTAAAGQSGSRSGDANTSLAWVLIPVSMQAQSEQSMSGCWVRLYSGSNYEGRAITIAGPANVAELQSPYGTGLNNWESAVVGPQAMVTTYDGDDFESRSATLQAGQRYADLGDTKLGLFEDIESIRVNCAQGGQSGSMQSGSTTSR